MQIKKLLVWAVVFSVLLNLALVSVVSGTGGEPTPPPPESGTIIVHKFNDANGNGVQDVGEMGIAGWLIRLYIIDCDGSMQLLDQGTTDGSGTVTFTDLPASYTWYKVWEEACLCWMPTAPDDIGSYDGGYYVLRQLGPGNTEVFVDFGNTYTCTPLEACTPGYWKNLAQRADEWAAAGLDPDADFDTTFGVDYFDPDITLYDAVRARGGGLGKVARFGTAALLSALHPYVDFALSPDQVIALVQAGDGDMLGDLFPDDATCPID